jgi:hypothetical protein
MRLCSSLLDEMTSPGLGILSNTRWAPSRRTEPAEGYTGRCPARWRTDALFLAYGTDSFFPAKVGGGPQNGRPGAAAGPWTMAEARAFSVSPWPELLADQIPSPVAPPRFRSPSAPLRGRRRCRSLAVTSYPRSRIERKVHGPRMG